MENEIRRLGRQLVKYLKKKMDEPESGCGKCGTCRHMCQLLDKKQDVPPKEKEEWPVS